MKSVLSCSWLAICTLNFFAFAEVGKPAVVQVEKAQTPTLPDYLVYRHFLGWIDFLETKRAGSGMDRLAAAKFSSSDQEIVKNHARSLTVDVKKSDANIAAVVKDYRVTAKVAASMGQPLPSPPPEIGELRAERIAMLVRHMAELKSSLGQQSASKMDLYLKRNFVPHLSLKILAHPAGAMPGNEASE